MFSHREMDGGSRQVPGAGLFGSMLRVVLVTVVATGMAVVGCTEGDMNMANWGMGGRSSAKPSSTEKASDSKDSTGTKTITVPEMTKSETTSETPSNEVPANKDMDQLHQRVQAYVNRFPANDLEQKVNGASAAPAAHAPEQATPVEPSGSRNTGATSVEAASAEPTLRITPIVEQEAPVESGEAASPSNPSGANAIRLPDPTEDVTPPKGDQQDGTAPREAVWDISDRAADEGEAWPAVTGQPARLPAQPESTNPAVELIEVRPAGAESVNEAPATMVESPANQPVAKVESPASGLADYLRHLEDKVAKNPHQFDDLYKLRLLYAATGQREKALAPVKDLDEAHAQLLEAMLSVIALGDQVLAQPSSSATEALTAVDELGRLLRQQSPVIIPNIAMVTRVNSFGDYVAVDPPVFEEGFPVHVFIYTEIANFRSEPMADGRLRTVLSEMVQVFDSTGKVVWEKSLPEFEDRTLRPRHDFFYPFEVKLPADLPAGQYALKVTVEDKLSATTDQQRLTFTIQ